MLWQRNLHSTSFFMATSVFDRTLSPNLALVMAKVDSTLLRTWYAFRKSWRLNVKYPYIRSHTDPGSPGVLLLLNGMKGTAPSLATRSRLSFDRYALSAGTVSTLNPLATVV